MTIEPVPESTPAWHFGCGAIFGFVAAGLYFLRSSQSPAGALLAGLLGAALAGLLAIALKDGFWESSYRLKVLWLTPAVTLALLLVTVGKCG